LGDSDFVAAVFEMQNESLERRYRLAAQGFDMAKVIKLAAEIRGLDAGRSALPAKSRCGFRPGDLPAIG
jgi:hypothetical protein